MKTYERIEITDGKVIKNLIGLEELEEIIAKADLDPLDDTPYRRLAWTQAILQNGESQPKFGEYEVTAFSNERSSLDVILEYSKAILDDDGDVEDYKVIGYEVY